MGAALISPSPLSGQILDPLCEALIVAMLRLSLGRWSWDRARRGEPRRGSASRLETFGRAERFLL